MKRINPIILLYFSVMSIYFGFKETPFEFSQIVDGGLIIVLCFIFLIWMFHQKYNLKTLFFITILFFLTLITMYTTRNPAFLFSVMSAIIISKSNYKDIMKIIFYERLIINLFINSCSILGLIQNEMLIAKSGEKIVCYSLGYNHSNRLACIAGMLILMYVCIKESNLKIRNILSIIGIVVLVSYITNTRTFMVIMVCMLILLLLEQNRKLGELMKKVISLLAKWVMLLCMLIAIGIPYIMANYSYVLGSWSNILNSMTSERFLHASRVISMYPIKLQILIYC